MSVIVASLMLIAAPLVVDSRDQAAGAPVNGSATTGAWSGVLSWPTLAVHAVLSPAGKVVTWGNGQSGTSFDVWDPALGTGAGSHQLLSNDTGTALFCSGQHVSPTTGEILTFGGELPDASGAVAALRFAPGSNQLSDTANPMKHPRWYPTTTRLPDGRTLVQGGSVGGFDGASVITPELFTPGSGWTELTGAASEAIYGYPANAGPGWYYPRTWVQSDGRIFGLSQRNMYYIDPSGAGSITPIPGTWNRGAGHQSTAVMYRPTRSCGSGG
ncbi:MAG: hypothetical protein OER93_03865 [Thermoleophilia bacterium]|nr:hypothetical protein [Gemmatimonadota bacterium]MDH3724866.1 hypothetical protein [Thermoleophilia bacterium]